jgi:hypothetical protein
MDATSAYCKTHVANDTNLGTIIKGSCDSGEMVRREGRVGREKWWKRMNIVVTIVRLWSGNGKKEEARGCRNSWSAVVF